MFASIKRTARTGRLRTELMLLDREVRQRQQAFGVVLYDYLEPLSKNANFFSADDRLTQVLRGPLLETQRETAVVYNKIRQLKERMKQAEVTRAAAFPTPAANWQEKMKNAGKSTALAASETKLKAEMLVLERELKRHKQNFGRSLYPTLEQLEDKEGWLPTDREVRTIYDACRKDIEDKRKKCREKVLELEQLGVSAKELQKERDEAAAAESTSNNSSSHFTNEQQQSATNSYTDTIPNNNYVAPPPAAMAPVHVPTPAPADAFGASAPTSSLPVASSVGFTSADTPSLAFGTVAPPPAAPAPPAPPAPANDFQGGGTMGSSTTSNTFQSTTPAGMGPIGGSSTNMMGGSSTNVMGGGAGMGFGGDDDDGGGFAMGGAAGTGLGTQSADPWGTDPFAAVPPPTIQQQTQAQAPPSQQQQQPGQHPDSNLFLY